jgi:hypothetical protein
MSQATSQSVERVYHIQVVSTRGYEHDDEDAFAWLQEHRSEMEAAGATVLFGRSFGGRGHDGTRTTIVFSVPADPKKQVKPDPFFVNTDLVEFSLKEVTDAEQQPALPKGAKEVSTPAPQPEAAQPEVKDVAG